MKQATNPKLTGIIKISVNDNDDLKQKFLKNQNKFSEDIKRKIKMPYFNFENSNIFLSKKRIIIIK